MDRQSVRQRTKKHPLPHSTSQQLRYERERLELQKRVTEQLVSDVLGLYEKSLFVDLKIEASRGNIYCHQLFFAARVPALWKLLQEIAKFQQTEKAPAEDLLSVQLPDIEYRELQAFIRTLYTDDANRAAGIGLRRKLEDKLAVLQQRALLCHRQIRIEKLSSDEEQHVQQFILEQLRLGQLSEQRGNVQDVQRLFRCNAPRSRRQTNPLSDSDTNSTATLTTEVTQYNPNTSKSVRPKSSRRIPAQKPKSLGNTMNITNHCVLGIGKSEIKEKQQLNISNEVCGGCDNIYSGNDLGQSDREGKVSSKGPPVPTKRASNDDTSPTGRISNQESPVFNVSMIKELQTSPMQVSGESFQDKLREKKDLSPSQSQKSANSEFTQVENVYRQDNVVCTNGDIGSHHDENIRTKGKAHKYGAMSSTRENASLHQANALLKQQQQHPHVQPTSSSKQGFQQKSQSFGAESQDSGDFDNASASNSGSEHRLSHLHETSSLEVELPSSHEENSSSQDSEGSPTGAGRRWKSENREGVYNHDTGEQNDLNESEESMQPRRPLVRARTFEVFDPIISGAIQHQDPAEKMDDQPKRSNPSRGDDGVTAEISGNPHVSFSSAKGIPASRSEERYSTGNGKERKISDEIVGPYPDNIEDPEKLREMERKKGSLLFEHNFQTYSNIPTTNMMTASMMTASMSSESSMGIPSLYSSMIDSAMLGSIHSLGALEAPIVDPIPRPASVGLPVMHQIEDPNPELTSVTGHRPELKGQCTEQMTHEFQREMARREQGSRSPSPDSLSVDFAAKREAEALYRAKASQERQLRKSVDGGISHVKKEEMDTEEKEQDDRENESRSSDSNPSEGKNEDKGEARETRVEDHQLSSLGMATGSPRLSRLGENKPIVSGGSTLKREKEAKEMKPIPKSERQVSMGAVKDVDAIPLVFGFIGPQDEEESGKSKDESKKEAKEEEEEKQPQSIFPMFIDLNEIPSPAKENPKETEKKEGGKAKAPSSSVYMYIEADTPSPKVRRKRKSESDSTALSKSVEAHPEAEFASLPPVLGAAAENKHKQSEVKTEDANETSDGGAGSAGDGNGSKEKKGFFVFIEADSPAKTGSPKPRRRPLPPAKKKNEAPNPMSRSAPSDSLVFSSQDSPSKLMTKSVIDRDEFIAQPPARKNVSLNDKINESSSGKDTPFVSGIPRPIRTLKSQASTKTSKAKPSPHKRNTGTHRDSSHTKDEPSETNDMATSRDISISELGPSQSISFSDVMSTSLPQETDGASEVSDVSSLLSSIERSNEPSDQPGSDPHSRLGEDLLRMFENEINTDVTIQIGEKRIRAHKCILASRCVYFAAMLSGHWVESAGNVIKLQGFSPDCVTVALKHIYSGSSTVPEGVRVGELAALADMLALDGLKDVISLHLKAKMCHYFHKPCSGCLEGVLDVLPIAGAYCLDELYHRCLRWVAKHFVVVLPTRNFAALPPEVQDRCLKQILDDMSVGNVIDTALGCERVLSSLPMVRWSQPVFDAAAQLLESATSFIAANLSGVLSSERFLALGKDSGWNIDSLEETMRVACELVRPDQAVLSHLQLAKLLEQNEEDGLGDVSESFLNFLENLLNQVEKFMIHNANRVAVCRKWPLLSTSTQRRIKDAAMVIVEFSRPTVPRPKLSSANRRTRGSSSDGSSGVACRGADHRLMRSASATAVPSSQRVGPRRPPSSGQDPTRCQTPPARLSRPRTQTPPPTRASTLRAQARQAAIQRSQSARTVAERPSKVKQGANTSTDEDSHSSGRRTTPMASFTRGATFTRSLSRPEPAGRARPHTPTRLPGASSRPRTPGPTESSQLPRRAATLNRTASHTTTGSSASEDEVPRKNSTASRGRALTSLNEGSGDAAKFARTQPAEARSRTPTRFAETRGSTSSLVRAGRTQPETQATPPAFTDSGSHTPRTPRIEKGEPRKQSDAKNGNIIPRSRGSTMGRRSTRSPMRDSGRPMGRTGSPTPTVTQASNAAENISRSSSVTNKPMASTTTPPSVGSRSNTFCKDNTGPNQKPVVP